MSNPRRPVLIRTLLEPSHALELDEHGWNALLLTARERGLLGKLGARLRDQGVFRSIPPKARRHLLAASIAVESSQIAVRFELNRVLRALRGVDIPLVLLKGAAYVAAELPPARGRSVGDLDLMVPRERIGSVERILTTEGWSAAELDDYDQNYYRAWTHEIPPLQHPERDTPIDIHHTIAPLTGRLRPDAGALLAASVPLADPRVRVLAPADMVLHSTIHLFNDDVTHPLRDLFDLHELLTHFGAEPIFWDALLERARLHRLERPLYYMLRHCRGIIGTEIPPAVERETQRAAPPAPVGLLMDRTFAAYFRPHPPGASRRSNRLASSLLYVRAHWMRMPAPLLARHLTVKAMVRLRERWTRRQEAANP